MTAIEQAAAPTVDVHFEWPYTVPSDPPTTAVNRIDASFDSIEQAKAFRDQLEVAIVRAERSSDQPDELDRWFESTDAQTWARAFLRKFAGEGVGHDVVDEGLLIGWFANAIAIGEAAGAEKAIGSPLLNTSEAIAEEARRWTLAHHGHVHFLHGTDLVEAYQAGARRDWLGIVQMQEPERFDRKVEATWECAKGGEEMPAEARRNFMPPQFSVDGPVCDFHAAELRGMFPGATS